MAGLAVTLGIIYVSFLCVTSVQTATTTAAPDSCFDWQFDCGNGTCLDPIDECDGWVDCHDGSDEDSILCANHVCDDDEFECTSDRAGGIHPACVWIYWVCDGDNDCKEGEDEADEICNITTTPEPQCEDSEFKCKDESCIDAGLRCNHRSDCYRGEDEQGCNYATCADHHFECASGECVSLSLKCDGSDDCHDKSDEDPIMCVTSAPTCSAAQFQCDNGDCLDNIADVLCNGIDECRDNSDESFCDSITVRECHGDSTLCHQKCVDTLYGYRCDCNSGYKLKADDKNCEDINECAGTPAPCSQMCQNTAGSYSCSCANGYQFKTNSNETCVRSDTVEPYLIFSNELYIRKFTIETNTYSALSDHQTFTHVLDYHLDGNKIYYADVRELHIKRMDFDGGNDERINFHFTSSIEGIAVDWIGKKLYWSSSTLEGIFVSELNGTSTKGLVKKTSQSPRALCVHPKKGYMLWTDWSYNPHIARAGMDGSNITIIHEEGIFWPNGLTIDYGSDKIYWVDAFYDRLEASDLDGTNRILVMEDLQHPYGLSVFEDGIYWSDWSVLKVMKAHKLTGENRKTVQETIHRPFDLHVVHPLRQPKSANPCGTNNGGCSHLCLISPGGTSYKCECPERFIMMDDGKKCEPNCTTEQFECNQGDAKCIPKLWFCDGEADCFDGQDEPENNEECQNRVCDPGYYQCSSDGGCIPPSFICDQWSDCDGDEDEKGCSERVCQPYQYRCESGQCITARYYCDGDEDCFDGTDEHEGCEVRECDPTREFSCDNGKCIDKLWYCDWDDDCGDASDEPKAFCQANATCLEGWVRCRTNYRCVPEVSLCDGLDNCRDNSDEEPDRCPACDPVGDFTCDNKQCIPKRWHCNHVNNCRDASDEIHCRPQDYRDCSEQEFRCTKEPQCIVKTYRCDMSRDCRDGSDEEGCHDHECAADQFKCVSTGQCTPIEDVCDTWGDCPDASDEAGDDCNEPCPNNRGFRCDNKVCVPMSYRCDAEDDCGDNSDEHPGLCSNVSCPFWRFQCEKSKFCLNKNKYMCNGDSECGPDDNSDEDPTTTCSHKHEVPKCDNGMFQCISTDMSCINVNKVCDRVNDCSDGYDELGCFNETCADNNGGCAYECNTVHINVSHSRGFYCSCDEGYQVMRSKPKECMDIDECASWGNFCPQMCTNTKGNYTCSCADGFDSVGGGLKGCIPVGASPRLLIPMGHEIRSYSVDDGELSDTVLGLRRISAIDVDANEGVVYWGDSSLNMIKRARIPAYPGDLGIPQDLHTSGWAEPEGLAYDWLGKNVIWCQPSKQAIYAFPSNRPTLVKTIVKDTNLDFYPAHIVVASDIGYMFWLDMNPYSPKIERAYIDGQSRKAIVSDDLIEPSGLAVDYRMGHRLFWADSKKETIESSRMDGTNRVVVREISGEKPYNLDVFAGYLYWNSASEEAVYRMDKFGQEPPQRILQDAFGSRDLKVLHAERYQYTPSNPCAMSQPCQAFCFPLPRGNKQCRCPDNMDAPGEVEGTCKMPSDIPVVADPDICSCNNHGICVLQNALPICQCDKGYTGKNCDPIPTTKPSPKTTKPPITKGPTTTERLTTTERPTTTTPKPTQPTTTTPKPTQPTTTTPKPLPPSPEKLDGDKSGDNTDTVKIVIPLVVIVIVMILILVILVVWLHRTGRLRKSDYRRHGNLGHDLDNISTNTAETSETHAVSFNGGDVKFSNPTYNVYENAKPGAEIGGDYKDTVTLTNNNGDAGPMPPKPPIY